MANIVLRSNFRHKKTVWIRLLMVVLYEQNRHFYNMNATIQQLIEDLNSKNRLFSDVISFIDRNYEHTPTPFNNGTVVNRAAENQGSAKILALGHLNNLTKEDTLQLFAEHYQTVLERPSGEDHQNIRQFMENGWRGVTFHGEVLRKRG